MKKETRTVTRVIPEETTTITRTSDNGMNTITLVVEPGGVEHGDDDVVIRSGTSVIVNKADLHESTVRRKI